MKRPSKALLVITFLIALVLAYFVTSAIMAPPNLANAKAEYTGSTTEFLTTIKTNPKDWTDNKKVVLLTGVITSKDKKGILLDDSVYFRFAEGASTDDFADGQKVQVKGSVETYDDVLGELNLQNAVLVKK